MSLAYSTINDIESRGLGWDVGQMSETFAECRIWQWPNVIARHRPKGRESIGEMLATAWAMVDKSKYPVKEGGQ